MIHSTQRTLDYQLPHWKFGPRTKFEVTASLVFVAGGINIHNSSVELTSRFTVCAAGGLVQIVVIKSQTPLLDRSPLELRES